METTVIINLDDMAVKRRMLTQIGALKGPWQFVYKPWKPRRSSRANAAYWAGPVASLQEYMREQGDLGDREEAHSILKRYCLGVKEIVNKDTGAIIAKVPKSTAELNSGEFAEYFERCLSWLGQMGIVVPDHREFETTAATRKRASAA